MTISSRRGSVFRVICGLPKPRSVSKRFPKRTTKVNAVKSHGTNRPLDSLLFFFFLKKVVFFENMNAQWLRTATILTSGQ